MIYTTRSAARAARAAWAAWAAALVARAARAAWAAAWADFQALLAAHHAMPGGSCALVDRWGEITS